MKSAQKTRGLVWLAIIAVAVAAAPSTESGSTPRRVYGPILNLLSAHSEAWPGAHAASAVLRTRQARGANASSAASHAKRFDSGPFRHLLASEFVGLVSPLTPESASTVLQLQHPPSTPHRYQLFQRPPPSQS